MQRNLNLKNRMREIRSSGTVGVRGGNEPLYPEKRQALAGGLLLNSKFLRSYLRKIRFRKA